MRGLDAPRGHEVSCGRGVTGAGCALAEAALAIESALTALANMSVGDAIVAAGKNVTAEVSADDVAANGALVNPELGSRPSGAVRKRSLGGLGGGRAHGARNIGHGKRSTGIV
jgi:hypothetical protein